jgi:hypothetical protein
MNSNTLDLGGERREPTRRERCRGTAAAVECPLQTACKGSGLRRGIDGQPGRAKRAGPKHDTARSAWARHGTASVGPVPARPDR